MSVVGPRPSLIVGAVAYANVAPLIAGIPDAWLRRGLPSEIAAWLAAGSVDVATVPVIELAREPRLTAWPKWGIAADGRCDSVLLFTTKPLREVRRVALDPASRTSSALVRVLLDREGARDVEWLASDGRRVEDRLAVADAALLIGDPALHAGTPRGVAKVDLAAEWHRHVGLPMVFACWATRPGRRLTSDERALLSASAESGLANLPELAEAEAARTRLPSARLEIYFRQLGYRLDERHVRGMQVFLEEAHRVGALAGAPQVSFQ